MGYNLSVLNQPQALNIVANDISCKKMYDLAKREAKRL